MSPLGADKNSLDWWKDKKEEYLTLARLARKYMCVPGTSIQTERVFLCIGCVCVFWAIWSVCGLECVCEWLGVFNLHFWG